MKNIFGYVCIGSAIVCAQEASAWNFSISREEAKSSVVASGSSCSQITDFEFVGKGEDFVIVIVECDGSQEYSLEKNSNLGPVRVITNYRKQMGNE